MAFTRRPPVGNVRRVVRIGRNIRRVTTNKCGHVVQFESELEHTLVLLFERDPPVADYLSQPEVLHFRDATGRPRTYTPDFKVWRTDGRIELHEVTVEMRHIPRESLRQREAAAAHLIEQGVPLTYTGLLQAAGVDRYYGFRDATIHSLLDQWIGDPPPANSS